VNKPIYEIPLTDPGAPPFGVPGSAGAMPPMRGQLPPDAMPMTDLSHLPPPSAAPTMAAPYPTAGAAPQYTAPAAAQAEPGASYAPPLANTADFTTAPPAGVAPASIPSPTPGAIPGYTPAPQLAPVLPVPSTEERSWLGVVPSDPPFATIAVVPDDEFARVARATADPELLDALQDVLLAGASDLHVSVGSPPMLRIDGALLPVAGQSAWDRERVAQALDSILTPEQRESFAERLELDFAFTMSANARFRVNFYQQRGAIGGAFRLIPTEVKSLATLGVPEVVAQFAKLARGLVLVTGPTGSGKSTTLAALIDLVNRTRSDHIVTVEDPIEFLHSNQRSLVNQREVGHDTHSFANALKHVLRQDPDVILIGELRDLETISVALTAAETGHLVFATLHTQDAGQTIDRVIDVFPPHQQGQVRAQLAATLQGVVCQTLVRRASGKGRAVATEVLITTPAIANLIREGKTYQVRSALQAGRAHGMNTMDQHLAELVNSGQVAYGQAIEKVHDPEDFKRLVHRTTDSSAAASVGFGTPIGTGA
jgi:twitching motility protein PilT